MTWFETAVTSTPAGRLALIVDPVDGAVVASGFDSVRERAARVAGPGVEFRRVRASASVDPVRLAVGRYGDGDLDALDAVAVRQPGGPFAQEAWRAMREVRAGSTVTYAELAARALRPRAVRAAGTACARNRVAPFVPCHRIVRSDGTLGGYFYGLTVKELLLRHEGAR